MTFPWGSAVVLAPLFSGLLVAVLFCFWEWKGARLPIVPSEIAISIYYSDSPDGKECSVYLQARHGIGRLYHHVHQVRVSRVCVVEGVRLTSHFSAAALCFSPPYIIYRNSSKLHSTIHQFTLASF